MSTARLYVGNLSYQHHERDAREGVRARTAKWCRSTSSPTVRPAGPRASPLWRCPLPRRRGGQDGAQWHRGRWARLNVDDAREQEQRQTGRLRR